MVAVWGLTALPSLFVDGDDLQGFPDSTMWDVCQNEETRLNSGVWTVGFARALYEKYVSEVKDRNRKTVKILLHVHGPCGLCCAVLALQDF
eukprot:IDg12656t1